MENGALGDTVEATVNPRPEHRRLCTLELIAEGHAARCPGESCAFWARGCVLERAEAELDRRPEVAALLLDLRRTVDEGRPVTVVDARDDLAGLLDETGPASGATELVELRQAARADDRA